MPTSKRVAVSSKITGIVSLVLLVAICIWQFTSLRAKADGTALLIPPVQGCIDATAYGLGLYSDGSGEITVNSPAPVVGAFIEWVGAEDNTPVEPQASVININGIDVVGRLVNNQVSYNATRNWYSWFADIGPNGLGIITEAGDLQLTITGWDNPNPRTNGATITIIYSTGECGDNQNTLQVLTGIDWFYHGTPDEPFSELLIYEYLPANVDRVATMFFTHAGLDVTASTCRGSAIWMLAGNGARPGYLADIVGRTASGVGVGLNGGVEIVNDPFTSTGVPCEPEINPWPKAPYQNGHPYPNGASQSPYKALKIRPDVGGNVGREWALLAVDVAIPANSSWVAFQFESEKDEFGHSGAWAGGGTMVLRETADTVLDVPPTQPPPQLESVSRMTLDTQLSNSAPTIGESVTFTYTVSNIGETQLSNINVANTLCGEVSFQAGDENGNGQLDLSEIWTFACSYVVQGDASEVVTASAITPSGDRISVSDELGIQTQPEASIVLTVDSDAPSGLVGTDVTYTYDIQNVGQQPLYDVLLTDDVCQRRVYQFGDNNENAVLDVGEMWQLNCTMLIWSEFTTSNLTVTARTADNQSISTSTQITVTLSPQPETVTDPEPTPVPEPQQIVEPTPEAVPMSIIGGTIWLDENQDQIRSIDEPTLSDVVVQIFRDENANEVWDEADTYVDKTVTSERGQYSFSVPAGNYLVYILESASPLDGLATFDIRRAISVESGQGILDVDYDYIFYEDMPDEPESVVENTSAGIRSAVWFDADGNGLQDSGELNVANVIVNLFNENDLLVGISVTDENGRFSFSDIPTGTYSLYFISPSSFKFTTPNAGDDAIDSDVNEFGQSDAFYVADGVTITNITAGLQIR